MRTALGAGRWRIMRQLLTESLMLSFAGGALGLLAGYWGMRWLLTVNTANLPRLGQAGSLLGMDWRIVLFTVGLSIVTGILFGLIPALVASRADLNAVIKDSSSRSGSGFRQNKTRSVLVLVEVSLAVVLLVGASLLIRTSLALLAGGIGLNALRESLTETTRTVLAVAAVALSLALTVSSYVRWRRVQEAMRHGVSLPHPWAVPLLATGVAIMAGAVAIILVT